MKDTLMPLFDGKVKFLNLKTISLFKINFKYVFSSSTLGSFVQLQHLYIGDCRVLEEIIRIDDLKNNVELPSLKTLQIKECPAMKSFIFSDKVTFPNLEEIEISDMDNLEMIWQNQFEDSLNLQCYPKLSKMKVTNCQSLKNLFPASIAMNLSQLKQLYVKNCGINAFIFGDKEIEISDMDNLEMICQTQFEDSLNLQCYPKLSKMTVTNCQSLKNLFPASIAMNLSQLKQLYVKSCGINAFIFGDKVTFPSLEEIEISDMDNLETIWQTQFEDSLNLQCYPKLSKMTVTNCQSLKNLFPASIAMNLSQLKQLYVKNCGINAFIFGDKVTFPSLEEIEISDMGNLETIWQTQFEDSQNVQNCQKLCKLSLTNCHSLKNLFPASVVGNLLQLKDIYVKECGIKEIVAKEKGAEEACDRRFVFPELTSLRLENLLELKCFYPGIHTTKWPMLKMLNVTGCDKIDALELFIIQEVISEDQLDIVAQEKVLPNLEELRLDGRKIKMVWQRPFPEILFPKLKFLEIQNDESTVLSPNSLPRSHNLERLSLENSSYKWIFSCEEVEEYPQIKSLYVTGLGNLKQIWKQDSKVDTILQNLENLVVNSCGSLVTLLPPSASFQNLTVLSVRGCRLINLISSSTAKSLMQLKEMVITDCKMMTEVVTGDGDGTEDEINFHNLKSLYLVCLSGLRRFCSGNYNFNFPSLEILSVFYCPEMRIFSSIAANTPMLREIRLDGECYYCDGDVNKTMERIH
ncbi:hypothetical protein Dsin_013049 [Dipteronia sinensis]|uniref:Disease resistance protein At4g27190-like leucine-rich repeats domain-containing protein n=1 Tax=Dipteronia sinensis TaxID=43782 RepID=A0AAE0AKF7_9ROSI|nr:hypothetical protein Dsin_013049 [Dipteronia sinensis]